MIEKPHHFMNIISHETQTPLTVIDTSVEMLRLHSGRMTEEQKRYRLDTIAEQSKRMRYTIDKMARAERWLDSDIPFHPQPISIRKYASDYLKDLDERAAIEFAIDVDEITVDAELLHLIVRELISNALKFSPEEIQIHLVFNASERELIITISDQGIGIPAKNHGDVFKPFFRGSNIGNHLGIGLGLYVVYESVKRYGGSIECTSEEGKGTTFEVHLPLP